MHWILYAALMFGSPMASEQVRDIDEIYHEFAKDVPEITVCDWYPEIHCGYFEFMKEFNHGE